MAYFPQLNASGRMVQRPYTTTLSFRTSVNDMDSGARYAYSWRGAGVSGQPDALRKASWTYDCITNAEYDTLLAFFDAQRGRRGEFSFLDATGNMVPYSELYSHASWERNSATVGGAIAGPFPGSTGASLTSSGSNANINAYVLPTGDANGFVLCASVWVRPTVAQSFAIGFIDSGFGSQGIGTYELRANEWQRIHHATRLTTNAPVRLIIGGLNTWTGGQQIALYGAQVAPTPGPGEYYKTSGGPNGLWAKCRFGTDTLTARRLGANHLSAGPIEIVEVA